MYLQCIDNSLKSTYNGYILGGINMSKGSTISINIRMDTELKKQSERLFSDLGLNMTTAFNIFLRQAVRQQRIPFDVALDTPNPVTIEAMKDADRISRDKNVTSYNDVDEMMGELLN